VVLGAFIAVVLVALLFIVGPRSMAGPAIVRQIDWSTTRPVSGQVVDGAVVVTADARGGTFPLITIPAPDLGTVAYAVTGEVRYASVQGRAYLEMWSTFADGTRYFSRTLETSGTTAALSGSSDWRSFELPFSRDGGPALERLDVNLVLPGAGSVTVGAMRVVRLDGGSGSTVDPWVGLVGGVAGSVIGLIGAAIGWLVPRQRGRTAVLTTMTVLVAVGVVLLASAAVSAVAGQRWTIVLLLLMLGAILVSVFGAALSATRRGYAEAELRRMRAMDRGA
jgi:hypothetical protein